LDNGSVVLFSTGGEVVNTVHLPPDTAALKLALDDLLARSGQ
jgi:hypothetical protein